jgi:hypothetical protein
MTNEHQELKGMETGTERNSKIRIPLLRSIHDTKRLDAILPSLY